MTVSQMANLNRDVNACMNWLNDDLRNMREQGDEAIFISEHQAKQLWDCLLAVEHLISLIFNNLVIPGTESR